MLEKVDYRRISLGLSVRQLAKQLEVSPSLLSMALNGKRVPSKEFTRSLKKWLRTPAVGISERHPAKLIQRFIDERSAHLADGTIQFYRQKLLPFALWCEKSRIADIRDVDRNHSFRE